MTPSLPHTVRIIARIQEIAYFMPENTLTNEHLAAEFSEWPANKILTNTGIRQRHIADPGQTASDLAYEAAQRLFAQGRFRASDVDFLIFCTQSADHPVPPASCALQHRLGISSNAGAIDLNAGCAGYAYGLSLAKGLIEAGSARRILFLTGETYSKYMHTGDRSARTLFGDGASATWISRDDAALMQGHRAGSIGPFVFTTHGEHASNMMVKSVSSGASPTATSRMGGRDGAGVIPTDGRFYMEAAEMMAFALAEVPRAVERLLALSGDKLDSVDLFVFQQTNRLMLEALRTKIQIEDARFPILMEQCGNMISSSIPVVLKQLLDDGRVGRGQRMMLLGFGAGYSLSGCMVDL